MGGRRSVPPRPCTRSIGLRIDAVAVLGVFCSDLVRQPHDAAGCLHRALLGVALTVGHYRPAAGVQRGMIVAISCDVNADLRRGAWRRIYDAGS
jgi:hypothetical protein